MNPKQSQRDANDQPNWCSGLAQQAMSCRKLSDNSTISYTKWHPHYLATLCLCISTVYLKCCLFCTLMYSDKINVGGFFKKHICYISDESKASPWSPANVSGPIFETGVSFLKFLLLTVSFLYVFFDAVKKK